MHLRPFEQISNDMFELLPSLNPFEPIEDLDEEIQANPFKRHRSGSEFLSFQHSQPEYTFDMFEQQLIHDVLNYKHNAKSAIDDGIQATDSVDSSERTMFETPNSDEHDWTLAYLQNDIYTNLISKGVKVDGLDNSGLMINTAQEYQLNTIMTLISEDGRKLDREFNLVNWCLEHPEEERSLLVMYPKITQKSYGSEKRFLCPQPTIYTFGPGINYLTKGWVLDQANSCAISAFDKHRSVQRVCKPYSINKAKQKKKEEAEIMSGLNSVQGMTFRFEEAPLKLRMNRISATAIFSQASTSQKLTLKDLYVNKSISGSDLKLTVNMYQSSLLVASIQSAPIKVISKPSKKASNKLDMGVKSGDIISLYNRIRSQTVTTRFIALNEHGLVGKRNGEWDAWRIWLLEDYVTVYGRQISASFNGKIILDIDSTNEESMKINFVTIQKFGARKFIQYGQQIILEHLYTGACITPLITRPVKTRDSESISSGRVITASFEEMPNILEGQQPHFSSLVMVSQMSKVAFEVSGLACHFLKFSEDSIAIYQSSSFINSNESLKFFELFPVDQGLFLTKDQSDEDSNSNELCDAKIDEFCSFTLVGVDIVESTYYQSVKNPLSDSDVDPFPTVTIIRVQNESTIVVTGSSFTEKMWVFLENMPAKSVVVLSSSRIIVAFDDILNIVENHSFLGGQVEKALLCNSFSLTGLVTVGSIVIRTGHHISILCK